MSMPGRQRSVGRIKRGEELRVVIDSVNHGGCEVKITGLAATLANQLSEEMITWKALACCCSIGEGV